MAEVELKLKHIYNVVETREFIAENHIYPANYQHSLSGY